MKRNMIARAITGSDPHNPISQVRKFSKSEIKAGLAHNWACDWARSIHQDFVIVCIPEGSHKVLAPMFTINLH